MKNIGQKIKEKVKNSIEQIDYEHPLLQNDLLKNVDFNQFLLERKNIERIVNKDFIIHVINLMKNQSPVISTSYYNGLFSEIGTIDADLVKVEVIGDNLEVTCGNYIFPNVLIHTSNGSRSTDLIWHDDKLELKIKSERMYDNTSFSLFLRLE